MTDTEKREAYLKARGWITDGTPFRCWSHPQLGEGLYLRLATHTQLDEDADIAIDAMLRLPAAEREVEDCVAQLERAAANHLWNLSRIGAMESKLSQARAVLLDMDAVECGAGIVGARCIDWEALRDALEVSNA